MVKQPTVKFPTANILHSIIIPTCGRTFLFLWHLTEQIKPFDLIGIFLIG